MIKVSLDSFILFLILLAKLNQYKTNKDYLRLRQMYFIILSILDKFTN